MKDDMNLSKRNFFLFKLQKICDNKIFSKNKNDKENITIQAI